MRKDNGPTHLPTHLFNSLTLFLFSSSLVKYEKNSLFDDELSFFRAKIRIYSYNTRSFDTSDTALLYDILKLC